MSAVLDVGDVGDGGPAFPVTLTNKYGQCAATYYGMSLRDYFAAKAMLGELTHYGCPVSDIAFADTAASAYKLADAMLRARVVKS